MNYLLKRENLVCRLAILPCITGEWLNQGRVLPKHPVLQFGIGFPPFGKMIAATSFGVALRRKNMVSPQGFEPWTY